MPFLPGLHRGPSCTHEASPLAVKNWRKLCPEAAGGVYLQRGKRITNSRMPLKMSWVAWKHLSVLRDKTQWQPLLQGNQLLLPQKTDTGLQWIEQGNAINSSYYPP